MERIRRLRPVRAVRWVAGAALDLLYPRRCFACDAEVLDAADLCPACRAGLVPILNPCPRCAAPRGPHVEGRRCSACRSLRPAFRAAAAGAEYVGPVPKMVRRLKYGGERFQAYVLGDLAAAAVDAVPFAASIDAIVPVPLARDRLRERGFNQAALLAQEVARRIRRPVRGRWLGRTRATLPQAGLSRAARLRNLEGCFGASPRRVRGRRVLLVDDVLTTGATLSEAARTLRRAGADTVFVAAAARA